MIQRLAAKHCLRPGLGQFLKLRAARLDVLGASQIFGLKHPTSECHIMSPVALKFTEIYAEIFSLNHESLLNHQISFRDLRDRLPTVRRSRRVGL